MRKFNLTLRPEDDRGLLAVIESEDKLTYIDISTTSAERVKWNNYTPTIPYDNSALPTYIQLLGCFNEVVDLELMKEYVLKAVNARNYVNLDLVRVGKSAGTFGMLYQIPGYRCFYSPEYCYVKTDNNEMYTLDNDSVPRGEIWDFLTLNAIVYILSKGENNLCYNDELKTPEGFSFKKNMNNTDCSLMYWDRYKNEDGETKFIRELKDNGIRDLWIILDKSRYTEDSIKQYEGEYLFLKGVVASLGIENTRKLLNMFNDSFGETYKMIVHLTGIDKESESVGNSNALNKLLKAGKAGDIK